MPQGKRSLIQSELTANINAAFKPQRLVRAFSELRFSFGGRSTVPDVTVFISDSPKDRLRQRIPCGENGDIANVFEIAPDWTIEVLSPDQSRTKVTKNILHCLQYGTQMGWLIDQCSSIWEIDPPKYLTKRLMSYPCLNLPKIFSSL
jgi:Uma2 family endonuclease